MKILRNYILLIMLFFLFTCNLPFGNDDAIITGLDDNEHHSKTTILEVFDTDGFSVPVSKIINNDYSGGFHGPDPDILKYGNYYYLYMAENDIYVAVYRSIDLVNWHKNKDYAFTDTRGHVWAPDVFYYEQDKKFYLYYTVQEKVGVVRSDYPWGPFTEDKKDLIDNAIDAHLFQDSDSKLYLYLTKVHQNNGNTIYGCEMISPTNIKMVITGYPYPTAKPLLIKLIEPTLPWEKYIAPVTEAPWMIKRNDIYYLMYSGSDAQGADYAIGYATSTSPLGDFTKNISNPIAKRSCHCRTILDPTVNEACQDIYGPGHNCVTVTPTGKLIMIYHQKNTADVTYGYRFLAAAPLWFDKYGYLNTRILRGPIENHLKFEGYINSAPPDNFVPLLRFWSPERTDHLYTSKLNEIGTSDHIYTDYEGIQGYIHATQKSGTIPLYRYWSSWRTDHFYTTNINEIGDNNPLYKYEGIQGYVYNTQIPGTTPLYRYWNPVLADHFYTVDYNELGQGKDGYTLEGKACYIYTSNGIRNLLSSTSFPDSVRFYSYDDCHYGLLFGTNIKEIKYGPWSTGIENLDALIR